MVDQARDVLDGARLREVMGHYPTGVVVVTGRTSAGEIQAMVVGTFSSVSLDPPLVSFMPMRTSRTFERLRDCESLCINIVGGGDEETVGQIARRWENKLEGIGWRALPSGAPVLDAAIAWLETSIAQIVEAGDHWIVLCAVHEVQVNDPAPPLIFLQGGYGTFVCSSLVARLDHSMAPIAEALAGLRPGVEQLARRIGCEVTVFTEVGQDEMAAVISAAAPGESHSTNLASRIPLVPPLGDSVVFDRGPEAQERWLRRLGKVDDAVVDRCRHRLDFLREEGWAMALLPDGAADAAGAYRAVDEAAREYDSRNVTPARERRVRDAIAATEIDYTPRVPEPDGIYNVASIVVPMRDAAGGTTLTVRLARLPLRATGAQVRSWVDDAVRLARSRDGVGASR